MPHVRSQAIVDAALAASDAGMRDADNAGLHGVAVKTIRRWRRVYQRQGVARGQTHLAPPCPRCDSVPLDEPAYAELLGWYLGDGYISEGRRGVFNVHVYNDQRYPRLNEGILDLMRRVKPGSRPHTRRVPGAVVSTVSWKHWPCLFPQHGPGRKHDRPSAVLLGARPRRGPVAPVGALGRVGVAPRGGGPAGRADRPEDVISGDGGRPARRR